MISAAAFATGAVCTNDACLEPLTDVTNIDTAAADFERPSYS